MSTENKYLDNIVRECEFHNNFIDWQWVTSETKWPQKNLQSRLISKQSVNLQNKQIDKMDITTSVRNIIDAVFSQKVFIILNFTITIPTK